MIYTNAITLPKQGLETLFEIITTIKTEKKDESDLLTSKLADDMFNLSLQIKRTIQQALEIWELFSGKQSNIILERDVAYSFDDYLLFISDALSFLQEIKEEDIVNPEEKEIRFFWLPKSKLVWSEYLLNFAIPNFYFHLVTTYNILRHKGCNLWKSNYLGANFGRSIRNDD